MILTTSTTNKSQAITNDFASGYFDASIGLTARFDNSEYWKGYLAYTNQTGKTPF